MNEDDVITGVINFLKDKHAPRKCKLSRAQAKIINRNAVAKIKSLNKKL